MSKSSIMERNQTGGDKNTTAGRRPGRRWRGGKSDGRGEDIKETRCKRREKWSGVKDKKKKRWQQHQSVAETHEWMKRTREERKSEIKDW